MNVTSEELKQANKRIAELEAELADERASRKAEHSDIVRGHKDALARAEKAEAEVKRLTAIIKSEGWLHLCECCGGRESGSTGPTDREGTVRLSAAAEPSARKERDG